MRKQMIKGFSMVLMIVSVAFFTAVVSANGQSVKQVVADIPFNFIVGDKMMTAGQYSVKAFSQAGDALLISERDTRESAIRLTSLLDANPKDTRARLVFHRYGQHYFLAEVWSGGDNDGRRLLRSRQERAIERELAATVSKSELGGNTYERIELLAAVR